MIYLLANRSLGPYLACTGPTAYASPAVLAGPYSWARWPVQPWGTFYDSSKPSKQQFGT